MRFGDMMFPSPSLWRFLRLQGLYLVAMMITQAVLWAIGLSVNPLTVLLYAFCVGNLITPPMNRVRCAYGGRPFPYNWMIYLATLVVLTPLVYAMASVVVWRIAPPTPQTLGHLLRTGWMISIL